jgi:hypothetical protein
LLKLIPEIKEKIDRDTILMDSERKGKIIISKESSIYRDRIYDALTVYIIDIYIIIARRHPDRLYNIYRELFEGLDVYQGDLLNGKKHGNGTMIYANGDVYDGDWKDDNMYGKGKFTKSQKWMFEGIFVRNKATFGTLTDGDKKIEKKHFIQMDILTLENPPEIAIVK